MWHSGWSLGFPTQSSGGSRISQTGGRQPLSLGQKSIIFARFSTKTAWKWKKLDRVEEGVRVLASPLDSPMQSLMDQILLGITFLMLEIVCYHQGKTSNVIYYKFHTFVKIPIFHNDSNPRIIWIFCKNHTVSHIWWESHQMCNVCKYVD